MLTSSNDFHATITKVIQGLNDAGFSSKDYRVAEEKPVVEPAPKPVQQEITLTPPTVDEEEFLQFDSSALKAIIEERQKTETPSTAIDDMLASAEVKSDTYDEELKALQTEPLSDLPLEVRSKVTTYRIYDEFKEEALALEIPQFYYKSENSLFAFLDGDYKELVSKEFLSDGFTLKDKSVEIDFRSATEGVAEVDVNKNEKPKYRFMAEAESEYFKEMFKNQAPESRIRNCKYQMKQILEKIDFVAGSELTAYIDRVVENMDNDELVALEKNVHGFAIRIKEKINALLDEYRRERFKHLLETGKIVCIPSFKLKSEINPGETFSLLSKSLYTEEQTMNAFERRVIEKVSSMPNIKWWHRNIERHEFCINGFINHYPDFIVMTNSGYIVMIETKGGHLTSNDDSREKAELGKMWQAQAGGKFRYYMVNYDDNIGTYRIENNIAAGRGDLITDGHLIACRLFREEIMYNWVLYVMSITFIKDPTKYTLSAGINELMNDAKAGQTLKFAALIIAMLPILIIYAIFQKPLQNGLSSSDGVKG